MAGEQSADSPAPDAMADIEARLKNIAGFLVRNPGLVTDFGPDTDPWIGKGACKALREMFGISMVSGSLRTERELITPPDGKPFWWYTMTSEWRDAAGNVVPAKGSCGSSERFVSGVKKDGTRYKDDALILRDVESFAETRMIVDAIFNALGIESLTWDDLERAGIDRSKCKQVERKKGGKDEGQSSTNGTTGKLPPRGDLSAKGYIWKTQKNEWEGLGETWKWIGDATKALYGKYWKVADINAATDDQLEAVARKLEEIHGTPAGTSPAQQNGAADAGQAYDFKAAYARIIQLGEAMWMKHEDCKSLLEKINGGPATGKVFPLATLDKAIETLQEHHTEWGKLVEAAKAQKIDDEHLEKILVQQHGEDLPSLIPIATIQKTIKVVESGIPF